MFRRKKKQPKTSVPYECPKCTGEIIRAWQIGVRGRKKNQILCIACRRKF